MARNLSDVRQEVKQILRGEFSGDVTDEDWKDDEIDIHIGHTLENISLVSPNVVKEVLTTIENSTELDISAIENLLWVREGRVPHREWPSRLSQHKKR